jgi:hypothetical protein
MTALDELDARLNDCNFFIMLSKDEGLSLLSAAREGERLREALRTIAQTPPEAIGHAEVHRANIQTASRALIREVV